MNAPLSLQGKCFRFAITSKGLLVMVFAGLLGACAWAPTSHQSLAELCAQKDLRNTSQRVLLAGGYHALANQDLVCAERLTYDARQKDLKDPYAALNLGAVYQRTGRVEQARQLYTLVLEMDGQKSESGAEPAHLATRDQHVKKRPAEIARHNLALLQR